MPSEKVTVTDSLPPVHRGLALVRGRQQPEHQRHHAVQARQTPLSVPHRPLASPPGGLLTQVGAGVFKGRLDVPPPGVFVDDLVGDESTSVV
jgi:hypothetical protein